MSPRGCSLSHLSNPGARTHTKPRQAQSRLLGTVNGINTERSGNEHSLRELGGLGIATEELTSHFEKKGEVCGEAD